MEDILLVANAKIYSAVSWLSFGIFEDFFFQLNEAMSNITEEEVTFSFSFLFAQKKNEFTLFFFEKMFVVLSDAYQISSDLFPRIVNRIDKHFESQGIKISSEMTEQMNQLFSQLKSTFCELRANYIIKKKLKWKGEAYNLQDEDPPGKSSPSFLKISKLCLWLKQVCQKVEQFLSKSSSRLITSAIIEIILLDFLNNTSFWKEFEECVGFGGLQQFLLDLRSMQERCKNYMTKTSLNAIGEMMEKSVLLFCEKTSTQPKDAIKPPSWFEDKLTSLDNVL